MSFLPLWRRLALLIYSRARAFLTAALIDSIVLGSDDLVRLLMIQWSNKNALTEVCFWEAYYWPNMG